MASLSLSRRDGSGESSCRAMSDASCRLPPGQNNLRNPGLLSMNPQIGKQHGHSERFSLFHGRTPPFGQRRIDERRTSAHQRKHMAARHDSEKAKVMG